MPFRVFAPASGTLVHRDIVRPTGTAGATLVTAYLSETDGGGFTVRMTDGADGRWPAADRTEQFGDRLVHIASRGVQASAWFVEDGTAVTVSGGAGPTVIVAVARGCASVT